MEPLPTEAVRVRLVSDALRNRLLSILTIALVTTALAALLAWKWPDSYTSSVGVMLTPTVGNALAPDTARSGDQINVAMQTEAGLIASPPVVRLVSEGVGSDVEAGDLRVAATVPANTQIIRIEYIANTANDAVTLADAYARALLESRRQRAENNVNGQLELLKEQEEAALAGLKQASADALSGTTPEASGMVQLYTNRLAAIQEKVGTLEATLTSPGTIISPASVPTSSDGIPAPALILAGLVAGLLFGVAYAISKEWGDDRIRADLEGTVDQHRVMGVVPPGPANTDGYSGEAYRTVRATMLASAAPPASVVIAAVDGTLNREAQHVALGTASALAAGGYKTCLVDASFIEGPIAAMPGARIGAGLAAALNTAPVNGIEARDVGGFHIIGGGHASEDTRERFASAHMRSVLTELSGQYDYVLVVSPDMSTPEANELGLWVDGVVLVAAERRTTREDVRRVTLGAERLGIVTLGIVAVDRTEKLRRVRRPAGADAAHASDTLDLPGRPGARDTRHRRRGARFNER